MREGGQYSISIFGTKSGLSKDQKCKKLFTMFIVNDTSAGSKNSGTLYNCMMHAIARVIRTSTRPFLASN